MYRAASTCELRAARSVVRYIASLPLFHVLFLCSQGGVEVPTGGMQHRLRARERLPLEGSSRSGEMPEPTVIVRMKENG
jgi:hypothetical protein